VFLVALLIARGLISRGSGEVTAPDLRGKTLSEAASLLQGLGLKLGSHPGRQYSNLPSGEIVSQDPGAQFLVRKGQAINVVLSLGVHYTQVPLDVIGLPTLQQARAALRAAGLKVGNVVSRNSSAPAGQILETQPAPGTRVPYGSAVTVFISNSQVKVPNVVGKDLATAETLLEERGFTVLEKPAAAFDKHQPENTVLSQTPAAGTFAPTGPNHPVTIFYNQQPTPSPSPSPSATESPSETPSPGPTFFRGRA
jgi:serine/threonine-protein kinase